MRLATLSERSLEQLAREIGLDALTFLQPCSAILVVCLITAPFWATISVGIDRLVEQRLNFAFSGRFAVSAECGPAGSTVSKTVNGASGAIRTSNR